MRTTIDYGIDLGTTNSAIAVVKGTSAEVLKNNDGSECTPSAVWIDKSDRLITGRRAKERTFYEADNAFCEFKLQMGNQQEFVFQRSGRRMTPPQLSAEVLKQLKADVRLHTGEEIDAAVITVPAAFELPQCAATHEAAKLAGFTCSPLVQEPVAAALAYGFQSDSDKTFWLVFDLGGGTFDAAVIHMRDGRFQVVNHSGDNHLGGKLIDWEIVDQLLVPAVLKQHKLNDFQRGNQHWHAAFAKLKLKAEEAKIRLSREESTDILVEFRCQNDQGEALEFECELTRADVERVSEPFLVRAINIARKALDEKRLGAGDIEKCLLVGGSTLMPYLRERLRDPKDGLGIALESGIDPLTVVARGAAVYAGTQRHESSVAPAASGDTLAIELEYDPAGDDPEPTVGGRVSSSDGRSLSGYTIEFINSTAPTPWRSGKLLLSGDNAFITTLWAEKGIQNVFQIELCDAAGRPCQTVPETINYTIGVSPDDPPLMLPVGIELANNEMKVFFEKGTPLPARKRDVRRTAFDIQRGVATHLIRIPVRQGENLARADRNNLIGSLEIPADSITRDIPAGSEVEVTIEIDRSQLVHTHAYIPLLDEEFDEVMPLKSSSLTADELQQRTDEQRQRLDEVRVKAASARDLKAQQALHRIEAEGMVHDVEASLAASHSDNDAADKCKNRLLDLTEAIDELEDALEWPAMQAEAEEVISSLNQVLQEYGNSSHRRHASELERETRLAMDSGDGDLLRRKINDLNGYRFEILREQPGFWVGLLSHLEASRAKMRNPAQAEQLFAQGQRAINNNDVSSLQAAVRQLLSLLPVDEQHRVQGGSTLI